MYAASQAAAAQPQDAGPLNGRGPLLAAQAPVQMARSPLEGSVCDGYKLQGPAPALPTNGRPLTNPNANYSRQNSHTGRLISPPMNGINPATMNSANHLFPRSQPSPFFAKRNSFAVSIDGTDDGSLKSMTSRKEVKPSGDSTSFTMEFSLGERQDFS